jgi:hypothetical protein
MHVSRAIVSSAGSTQRVAHSAGRFNGSYAAIQAIACRFLLQEKTAHGSLAGAQNAGNLRHRLFGGTEWEGT